MIVKTLILILLLVPGLVMGSDKVPFACSEWVEMVRSVIKAYAAENPEWM